MNEALTIKGTQNFMGTTIPVVYGGFGKGQKCISDKTVSEIHGQTEREIRRRISDNIKRFKENIDYVDMKQRVGESHTLDFLLNLGYAKQSITQAEHIYILSERGYAKLVKIMDTDLAWEIHDRLIDEYFELREKHEIISSPATPLTREELASYMLYTERHVDVVEKMMNSFIDNQTKSMQNFCNMIFTAFTGFSDTTTSTLNIIKELNENLVNRSNSAGNSVSHDMSVDIEEEQWKQGAFNTVNQICKNVGTGNGNSILSKLYKTIKEKDGIDLTHEKKIYMKNNNVDSISTISVIAKSDTLKDVFDKRARELLETTFCSDNLKPDNECPYSVMVNTVPDVIYKSAKALLDTGIPRSYAMRLIYKEFEELSGLSLANVSRSFAEKHNVKNVNRGYVISQDKKLMAIFNKAVNSVIRNRGLAA